MCQIGKEFMTKDNRSRKCLLTFNNPIEHGYTHEHIRKLLEETKQCIYWCMSDEIGLETKTFHTHVYIACSSAVRFSVLKKRFPDAHIDFCQGTSQQNRDYVFKTGKWADTEKEETNIKESHEEWGEIPIERQGARNDITDLYDMIKDGMTDYEILESNPQYLFNMDKIERVRQTVNAERFKNVWRELDVTYIYGDTGAGKTRSIMEKYGYSNVYRVTDYEHPFDGYKGQDVIVFEEFRSSLRIDDMLNYLDGYPVELRCRYANKQACYTKVYIVSNISLHEQYMNMQKEQTETWKAFLRRIHHVKVYMNKSTYDYSIDEYLNGFIPTNETPFD